jgi:hypothetical protein
MKRASYRDGVFWLAVNDDTDWVDAEVNTPSVTACLLADLFGVDTERVRVDVRRELKKQNMAQHCDELVAALKRCADALADYEAASGAARCVAETAIARAKGEI